jgi:hypothetical protein
MSILATNMAATLRSLTKSPITSALDQARRMAKQHLESGGNVTPGAGGGDEGVVLPAGVDVGVVAAAISAALIGSDSYRRRQPAAVTLSRRQDGRFSVRRDYVKRLGDGDFDRVKRRLAALIAKI